MLEKRYSHKQVENGKYDFWLKHKYFSTHDLNKTPFSIVIPPPNVTGKLHLGHGSDTIPADIIIRYKKMKGFFFRYLKLPYLLNVFLNILKEKQQLN